jgi:hypothetical protein
MCDDLETTLAELKRRGVTVLPEIHHERWGNLATLVLPGGGEVGIYEPTHPRPEAP